MTETEVCARQRRQARVAKRAEEFIIAVLRTPQPHTTGEALVKECWGMAEAIEARRETL